MRIVTHNSIFHTDDVFAVATLLLLVGEAEVLRSRDPEIIKTGDYVVDVGYEHDPARNHFDHHQPGGAGKRENGIEYASFGLVWKEFGEKLSGGAKEAEMIDRELVQPIDAHDNGLAIAEYKFEGVREYTVGDFFASYRTSRDSESLDESFLQVVQIAKSLLEREIANAKIKVIEENKVRKFYEESQNKKIVILEESLSWKRVLAEAPEPVYVVSPRPDGNWSLGTVSDNLASYGHLRKPLPEIWAGKKDEELQKITGVSDALFAHRGRFMATARTKEGALALAELALKS